jgi:hypothetical protein
MRRLPLAFITQERKKVAGNGDVESGFVTSGNCRSHYRRSGMD